MNEKTYDNYIFIPIPANRSLDILHSRPANATPRLKRKKKNLYKCVKANMCTSASSEALIRGPQLLSPWWRLAAHWRCTGRSWSVSSLHAVPVSARLLPHRGPTGKSASAHALMSLCVYSEINCWLALYLHVSRSLKQFYGYLLQLNWQKFWGKLMPEIEGEKNPLLTGIKQFHIN